MLEYGVHRSNTVYITYNIWNSYVTQFGKNSVVPQLRLGIARTVYIHRMWPYIWWFSCQIYRICTVYIWCWPTLITRTLVASSSVATWSKAFPLGRSICTHNWNNPDEWTPLWWLRDDLVLKLVTTCLVTAPFYAMVRFQRCELACCVFTWLRQITRIGQNHI